MLMRAVHYLRKSDGNEVILLKYLDILFIILGCMAHGPLKAIRGMSPTPALFPGAWVVYDGSP